MLLDEESQGINEDQYNYVTFSPLNWIDPGLSPFPSPNQVTLDFEGNSVSEGRTTPSDVERDRTSLNESEATGVRERRDSGVGASLTRPNRWVMCCYKVMLLLFYRL